MMEIMILIIIVITISAFIYWPYRVPLTTDPGAQNGRARRETLTELEDTRDSLLQTIKDLEFDHQTGKLSPDDFKELNITYRQKAVRVLKSIAAIREGRKKSPKIHGTQHPTRCASCGAPTSAQARFCSHCGTPIH